MNEILRDLRIALRSLERAQVSMAEDNTVLTVKMAMLKGMLKPVTIGARLLLEEANMVSEWEK